MRSGGTRITLLGRLGVEHDGNPVAATLPGRRSELVFAYLAAEHRRMVSRDELADALWPSLLPDTWAPALRGVVSDVRRFLDAAGLAGQQMLVSAGGGYRLRLPEGVDVDLDEARAAVADARGRLTAGAGSRADAEHAAEHAERGAALARLPFLPGHDGTWVDDVRKQLDDLLGAALELQVQGRRQAGDPRAAAAAAQRLVLAEPFSESAHRLRIEVLAEAGDRAGAIRAYEDYRAVLAAELGIEPSPETQSLVQPLFDDQPNERAAAHDVRSALVVEDHDFQRRAAVGLLRRLGVATVLEATDGDAALELLADGAAPDVIVVDIDMPGMDGVELVRHVSERRLATAVVILSGLDRRLVQAARSVAESYGLDVLGAVEKPLTTRGLSALLAGYPRPAHDPGPGTADTNAVAAHVQPIIDLGTGSAAYAEAVPWPAIASGGHDERLLALACELDLPVHVALRLDRAQADAPLADRLIDLVREAGGDAHRLTLMFDERALGTGALESLTRLRAKGFGVWLDGFQGRTATLDRLPLTGLRLAPGLLDGRRDAALQQALDVAREHDLPVVGNGCAGAAQFELLLQLGCAFAQGPFVGEAMPPGELARWTTPVGGA